MTKKITPQQKVRAKLMKKVGHSMSSWAKENEYSPDLVGQIVYRWAGKTGIPRGDKTRQILTRLEETLGKPIYTKID